MRNALGFPQTVLVLGGRSDIGLAIVRRLQEERPLTAILALREPDTVRLSELESEKSTIETEHFDADDRTGHAEFVERVFARHGDIDLIVVAFGLLVGEPTQLAETNFLGAVSVLTPIAHRLRAQGHGAIVVLSSIAAVRPRRSNYAYGASKAGLDAFANGLGDELSEFCVHMLVVRPGFVKTKLTAGMPAAPFATTADAVAEATIEALRRGDRTVWVPRGLAGVALALRLLPRSALVHVRR